MNDMLLKVRINS